MATTPSLPPAHEPTWRDDRSRRDFLRIGSSVGAFLALGSLPVFTPRAAADVTRPSGLSLVPAAEATTMWYSAPGTESNMITQGLPIGNGRIGALVSGNPASDAFFITDASMWTGGTNATLGGDGQYPYGDAFGSFTQLAKAYVKVPGHTGVTNYRRQLDLSNGYVSASYTSGGVTYTRETYASHVDDVIIVRLTQGAGGSYTGSVSLVGQHGETTTAASKTASFSGTLANGLKYGCVVTAKAATGTVSVSGNEVTFTNATDVVIVISGGTNYVPEDSLGFKDSSVDPKTVATTKATAALAVSGTLLLATHVEDYRALYETMSINLGSSTATQRALNTGARLAARAAAGSAPDPELEASYLQFGRYLTITGSRGGLPTNLFGLWPGTNTPNWMGDYHTNINLQMNYWLPDRAGLSECFTPLADYCLAQMDSWTSRTQASFLDSRNPFRNTSGRVAGWTVATSTNVYGGVGWNWNPAGNAWLCNTMFEHYEFTKDSAYLTKIYPLLKGACQFWEARLLTQTVDGKSVLVSDLDWSPEHGPTGQKGISYAQELVWQLFANYVEACTRLGVDSSYAATVAAMKAKLYLPQVSATTGWLEEWMTDDNLGETQHRHLSGLVGFHPGDRITHDRSPVPLLNGVRNQLIARGMDSYGWSNAWRALCWGRFKHAANAYQLVITTLKPSTTAINFFDMYSADVFQIDANYGTPTAMLEMVAYSRPGLVELLPATPTAWGTGSVRGLGVRGGFTLDMNWANGNVTTATLHSVGGTSTRVKFGTWGQNVTMASGGSVTVTPPAKPANVMFVNRRSGKVIDVPGWSTASGTALIQWSKGGGNNQRWRLTDIGAGIYSIISVHSSLGCDVNGGSSADDVTIIQWPYGGGTNQQWMLSDNGDGYFKIVNIRSGKVMGVRANSTSDGAAIVQQADTNDLSQQWSIVTS